MKRKKLERQNFRLIFQFCHPVIQKKIIWRHENWLNKRQFDLGWEDFQDFWTRLDLFSSLLFGTNLSFFFLFKNKLRILWRNPNGWMVLNTLGVCTFMFWISVPDHVIPGILWRASRNRTSSKTGTRYCLKKNGSLLCLGVERTDCTIPGTRTTHQSRNLKTLVLPVTTEFQDACFFFAFQF